jgi:quercetin dioxygenase-like cupin family protein
MLAALSKSRIRSHGGAMATRSQVRLKVSLLTFATLVFFGVSSLAGRPSQTAARPDVAPSHGIVTADGLKWEPFVEPSQMALVSGDPSQAGPFVLRIKSPAGTVIPAHWHPTDENLTVLEGKFAIGTGDAFDAGKLTVMQPGDFIQMPAKMHHFSKAATDTVVQIHGTGPFAVTFLNPKDDPRLKQ